MTRHAGASICTVEVQFTIAVKVARQEVVRRVIEVRPAPAYDRSVWLRVVFGRSTSRSTQPGGQYTTPPPAQVKRQVIKLP